MSIREDRVEKTGPRKARQYTGEYGLMSQSQFSWFCDRFDLVTVPGNYVGVDAYGHYVFKLHDSLQRHRGYQVRRHRWGDTYLGPLLDGPKASTYMADVDSPVQSFYVPTGFVYTDPLVLVEDPVSAIKVAQAGLPAVALLSIAMTMDKVREIASTKRPVVFAYDKDATEQAFLDLQKWGPAFTKASIVMLERDLKDTPRADVTELFAEWL